MIRKRVLLATVTAAACAMLIAGTAMARPGAALVLQRSGAVKPDLQPYTEIPASATVTVGRGAKLVFLDYRSCMKVSLDGGIVKFGPAGYSVVKGKESHTRVPCPGKLELTQSGRVSAIYLRGADTPSLLTLPSRPNLALVGNDSGDFKELKVMRGGSVMLSGSLVDRHFEWPAKAKPLISGKPYVLVLVPRTTKMLPRKIGFTASDSAHPEALVLIRVDQ